MCGIAGMFGFGDHATLRAMTDAIAHRGPDGEAFYQEAGILLGNRRLAIQDVADGAQPMANEDGSIVVVYNGEIYNYPALRAELVAKGHLLRTRCDTELLPHLYEEHGIALVGRLNGIFAFALWDRRARTLWLARDPLGVKPLVYARRGGKLAFGSEVKAILASGLVDAELDEASLHLTMNVRYVPGTRTLFAGVSRLAPGCALEVNARGARVHPVAAIEWTPDGPYDARGGDAALLEQIDAAVERQLLSDVPVGISLSGGIDSSTLVALVRRRRSGPLNTFTLGFNEPTDEIGDARIVAERFETTHHEVVLTEPAMKYLREAIFFAEEPKVNCLQLYLLHRFIGSHVKVVLSGLGGDELFAGYDFYRHLQRLAPLRAGLPPWIAHRVLAPAAELSARMASRVSPPALDLYVRGLEWIGSLHDPARHYLLLRNAWDFNSSLMTRVYTPEFRERLAVRCRDEYDAYFPGRAPVEGEALRAEFATKMVNDLLHNEDTMSMAHSVESRVPLLDLELVRYAARIPDRVRFAYGTKGLLRRAVRGLLPHRTMTKKKWGFTVNPVEQYRKDLRRLALEWLTPERLRRGGVFEPRFVERVLQATPRAELRWHYFMLWQMVGLEMWRDLFLESRLPTRPGATQAGTAAELRGAMTP